MTSPECAVARDAAPELALGLLDGATRSEVLAHVHRCPACQSVVAELAGVADLLVQLAPEAEPPPGFGRRVVAETRRSRRSRRRAVAALAAVAAAATIGAVGVVRIVDASRSDDTLAAPQLVTSPMRTPDGAWVGRLVATDGTPAGVAVNVDYSVPDGSYELVVRRANGSTGVVGNMDITGGRGSWKGPVDGGRGAVLEMVDGTDTVVCSGELPA